eukprot:gnl/Trimastix_PCT/2463.p1 GENE.gnl/Trimastix_PCT/2463~~gnl/Trimastix_PCT/2463.p1  ORF type:complete len:538 (+),score=118.48 gnl/Trimastix_PCT/2463:44-1657(+)
MSGAPAEDYHCFTQVRCTGIAPPPRGMHTTVVYGNSLYLYGGDGGGSLLSAVFQCNLDTCTWSPVPICGSTPASRAAHTAVVYGHSMFVFGGHSSRGCLGDLYQFDFNSQTWTEITPEGERPTGRMSQSAVVWGHEMYVFGGKTAQGSVVNEFFAFDLEAKTWRTVESIGEPPSPREMHAAVVYGDAMYVFGGHNTQALSDMLRFDFVTRTWSEIKPPTAPKPRYRHSAVVRGDSLVIFGGYGTSRLADLHVYNFGMRMWMTDKPKNKVSARHLHSAVSYGEHMWIVCGHDGSSPLNELVRYTFLPPTTLCQDMERLLLRKHETDSVLFSCGVRHPVHHCVIASRCPALLPSLLYSSSSQPEHPGADLQMSDECVSLLLRYLYTDDLGIESPHGAPGDAPALDVPTLVALLDASIQLSLPRLKILSSRALQSPSVITSENVYIILNIAHDHSLPQLRKSALTAFIRLLPFSLSSIPKLSRPALADLAAVLAAFVPAQLTTGRLPVSALQGNVVSLRAAAAVPEQATQGRKPTECRIS